MQIPTSVLHLDGCEVSTDSSLKCLGPDSAMGFLDVLGNHKASADLPLL